MKKYGKYIKTLVGVLALACIFGMNARHALTGYGVKDGKLHTEVLAQSGNSSKSSSSNSFTFTIGGGYSNSSGLGGWGSSGSYNIYSTLIYNYDKKTKLAISATCNRAFSGTCNVSINLSITWTF